MSQGTRVSGTEHYIKEALANFRGSKIQLQNLAVILDDEQFNSNFQIIKIQFLSLDYFSIETKTHTERNIAGAFWNLTSRGKKHLAELKAIRKKREITV